LVKCTGTYLDYNNINILITWCLWSSEHPLNLLHLNFRLRLYVIYHICKIWTTLKCAMHGVQSAIWCINRSILSILTRTNYFTNLLLVFLSINKLTKYYKINNMHFMNMIILSDFTQVLNINRKHYTQNDYFSKHV
jgi:hypothetical protein